MANEFDRWFVDLYAPPRLKYANELTTENTTTSAYLGFDLERLHDKNRAQWMFPRHLSTKDFHVITVLKKDLPAWKQHVLKLDNSAFDIPETEDAQSGMLFGVPYTRDPTKHTVKRTSIRMVMDTSTSPENRTRATDAAYEAKAQAPAAFAKFKANKNVVYRRQSMNISQYENSIGSNPQTMQLDMLADSAITKALGGNTPDDNIDEIRHIEVTDDASVPQYIVNNHESHTKNTKYYFEHDHHFRYVFSRSAAENKLRGVLTDDTIKNIPAYYFEVTEGGQTTYYWFETMDMYETLVPSCHFGEDKCKSCYVSSDMTLTDDDLKACTDNFNTLMGIIQDNENHLKQCNPHKRGDLPGVIWPMYAWTLQLVRMPTAYLNKIGSGIYVSAQDHLPNGTNHTIQGVNEIGKDIDVRTFDLVTRSRIAHGKGHAMLDTDKKKTICMVPQTLGADRVRMKECVAGEETFRYTARHAAIPFLFGGILIYTFFGLLFWGSLGHIFEFNTDTETKKMEKNRNFPLQYFSNTRPQAEVTTWLERWGYEWIKDEDAKKYLNWTMIGILVIMFFSFLSVLLSVSVLPGKIGPSCMASVNVTKELFAMYTSDGKDAQSYVKNTVAIPFVVFSWIVVVIFVFGAFLNFYENLYKTPTKKTGTDSNGDSTQPESPNVGSGGAIYMALPSV